MEKSHTSSHKKRGRGLYPAKVVQRIKAAYVAALLDNGGVKKDARESAGNVDRKTIEAWKAKDADFAAAEADAIEQGSEDFGDLAEKALKNRVKQGDTTAIIFALKTKFKNRGYIEKRELTANVDGLTQTILVNNAGEKSALETLDNLGV